MRSERAAVAALALAALIVAALVPTHPNYDSYYHLVWGRELLHGTTPSFEAYSAPTQHPLFVVVCALVGLAGGDGDRVLVALTAVALVLLAWGVFRLTDAVFGRWPALLAAFFTGSSFALLLYAARAYVDIPFLALVLWAAALAQRGARPRAVAAVLAVAGLLRPEAWVLAGLYWVACGPARRLARLDLLALAAAAPVFWALVDLAVTGDPLYSLHATSDLADELNRNTGLSAVPGSFVSFLSATVRPPVAAAAVLGVVLAWRVRGGPRSFAVPLALFAAGALTFLATGLAGLSVLPRYLTVPAVALCVFAGYGVAGWTTLPPGAPARRPWRALTAAAVVVGLVFFAVKAPVLERLVTELRFTRGTHDELVTLLRTPQVREGLRCGPLTFPNFRLVPDARWILDLPAERVGARSAKRRDAGVAVFVLGQKTLKRYGFADGASPSTNVPDPGFAPLVRVGRFSAYARCPGRRAPAPEPAPAG
jgi:hypothetical protein